MSSLPHARSQISAPNQALSPAAGGRLRPNHSPSAAPPNPSPPATARTPPPSLFAGQSRVTRLRSVASCFHRRVAVNIPVAAITQTRTASFSERCPSHPGTSLSRGSLLISAGGAHVAKSPDLMRIQRKLLVSLIDLLDLGFIYAAHPQHSYLATSDWTKKITNLYA